jgi:hypothetical protein
MRCCSTKYGSIILSRQRASVVRPVRCASDTVCPRSVTSTPHRLTASFVILIKTSATAGSLESHGRRPARARRRARAARAPVIRNRLLVLIYTRVHSRSRYVLIRRVLKHSVSVNHCATRPPRRGAAARGGAGGFSTHRLYIRVNQVHPVTVGYAYRYFRS